MSNNIQREWETRASKLFCLVVAVAIIWVTFKYVIGIILPFLAAFVIAAIIYPLSIKISKKTKISHKLWAFLLVLLSLVVLSLSIVVIVNRLITEAGALLEGLDVKNDGLLSFAEELINKIKSSTENIPILKNILRFNGSEEMISEFIKNMLLRLGNTLTSFLGAFIINTPSAFISIIVSLVACIYLSMDFKNIASSLLSVFPKSLSSSMESLKSKFEKSYKGYIKAYLILFLITFSELFLGLWILKRRYAFLTALIIAAVDILPVLGTGIILVPWGILMIIEQNFFVGFGLLTLYAIVIIVRQITEPYFIGESLGLHPLLSLFSMFAGLKLFGIIGMLFAPPIAILIKEVIFKRSPTVRP
jgi:sporulation integral membrane protein YtvI